MSQDKTQLQEERQKLAEAMIIANDVILALYSGRNKQDFLEEDWMAVIDNAVKLSMEIIGDEHENN